MELYHITKFVFIFIIVTFKSLDSAEIFHQQLVSLEDCNLPSNKMDMDSLMKSNVEVLSRNGSDDRVISGNITVPKKTLPLSFNVRIYKISNSRKNILYKFEDMNCRNPLVIAALKEVKFQNDKNCCAFAGVYFLNDVGESQFRKSELIILPPGMYVNEFEVRTQKGVVLCFSSKIIVQSM